MSVDMAQRYQVLEAAHEYDCANCPADSSKRRTIKWAGYEGAVCAKRCQYEGIYAPVTLEQLRTINTKRMLQGLEVVGLEHMEEMARKAKQSN